MNSRMDHPISHNTTTYDYDDDPHRHDQNVGIEIGHNEEQHGEKKSVLKKVKAKAKKIKDSIKEHVGHGHDHDEDEDEDDEMDIDPETHGAHTAQYVMPGKESATRLHTHTSEQHFGEGTADERTRTKPSLYHTFDPTNATHTPGHEETLGWSTDTERSEEYNEQPYTPKNTPAGMLSGGGHSTGDLDMEKKGPPVKLGTVGGPTGVEEECQVAKDVGADQGPVYQVRVIDPTGTGVHRTEKEEMVQSPRSKFQGDFQTFDPSTTRYVSGHEDSLDWSRTDTGRLHRLDDLTSASTNTAIPAQSEYDSKTAPGIHRSEVDKRTEREGIIHPPKSTFQGDFQTFDPSTTRYVPGHEDTLDWSRTDTGRPHKSEELSNVSKHTPITDHPGGVDVGVTPIMHQLDKMNIYDEPHQNPTRRRHSPEDKNIFTGSHDQFSPEPITSKTNTLLQDTSLGSERSHNMSDQKEESYTEKISSTAAMMADKAKQATNSVTSKLGYGDSSDQHSADVSSGMNEKSSEPMSYGEKISNVTSAITDKAVQAKDVVANKLGYGGNQEEQHHEKRDPVYGDGNVATVALKMQDSGTEPEVHSSSTTEVDKGVSMKEYLAEKLRPGEEDKALSDVITGALPLHKHKEDVSKAGEEGKGDKVTIIGRVTESEEVARQFGRGEETNYDDAGTGVASPGKGVLDRLKDAASFWFQKGTEMPSQDEMVEGNEGSPVISGMESEQKKEQ